MTQFLLCERDLNDKMKFNQESLRRKYIKLSKMCHPDRLHGDEEVFMQLTINYGLLQGLLENRSHNGKPKSSCTHDMKQIEYRKMTD